MVPGTACCRSQMHISVSMPPVASSLHAMPGADNQHAVGMRRDTRLPVHTTHAATCCLMPPTHTTTPTPHRSTQPACPGESTKALLCCRPPCGLWVHAMCPRAPCDRFEGLVVLLPCDSHRQHTPITPTMLGVAVQHRQLVAELRPAADLQVGSSTDQRYARGYRFIRP